MAYLCYCILKSQLVSILRLSLCEIEYKENEQLITVNLKLFLTDVNEQYSLTHNDKLAFCQPDEAPEANELLMNYINKFFT